MFSVDFRSHERIADHSHWRCLHWRLSAETWLSAHESQGVQIMGCQIFDAGQLRLERGDDLSQVAAWRDGTDVEGVHSTRSKTYLRQYGAEQHEPGPLIWFSVKTNTCLFHHHYFHCIAQSYLLLSLYNCADNNTDQKKGENGVEFVTQ